MNDTINQVGAGAPAAWTKTKPTAPGAYWIRGAGEGMLARTALVEVVNFEGELWCNLHMRNTDPEFGYGYTVAQLDEAFEWLGPLSPAAPVVQHSDDAAVDRFAAAMKEKLAAARAKGRAGWDDPNVCPVETLAKLLISHLRKGNAGTFEDVANFAMMLHQRGADPRVLAEAAPVVQAEPVATILPPDPLDERSGSWLSLEDWERLQALPAGTKLYAAPLAAQPAVGEEIMVNAAHDVYTLPLQPSGLDGQGPRFVVHVPPPEPQPAASTEPVAWVAADTLNSPHPTCISSLAYMSQLDRERGREYVPLYAAPLAAEQQPAPDVACSQSRESAMVVLEQGPDGTPSVWCDPEIADLVSALNKAGIRTVASCSGHGYRPGNIALSDGRELVIARDFDEARKIDAMFPGINGEPPVVQAEPVAWLVLAQRGGMRDQRSLWIDERGADQWFDHMISRGCAVMKTPLYAAPPAQPDASVLVEALELARRTLAMAGLEGEVTRRIDTALAGKGGAQ